MILNVRLISTQVTPSPVITNIFLYPPYLKVHPSVQFPPSPSPSAPRRVPLRLDDACPHCQSPLHRSPANSRPKSILHLIAQLSALSSSSDNHLLAPSVSKRRHASWSYLLSLSIELLSEEHVTGRKLPSKNTNA
ncbi:hypothetical protein FCM35_KLT16697 [Carex littledalei]|uniref:Uncharacterized protein n=1 Tax=Carex littledalei TaxID=544730 RepID=A0A833RHL7_9POAL|nr:hypothetical protein FCM35_KLT16697 [Carex littledalei]